MKNLETGKKKWKIRIAPIEMRRVSSSFEEVMELPMTETQREVFLIIDEWWKKFGYGPSLRDIIYLRKMTSISSTKKVVDRLVKLGAVKKVDRMGRSVRPVYVNFRNLE